MWHPTAAAESVPAHRALPFESTGVRLTADRDAQFHIAVSLKWLTYFIPSIRSSESEVW